MPTGIRIALQSGILLAHKEILVGSLSNENQLVWTTERGRTIALPSISKLEQGEIQLALSGKAWAYMVDNEPWLANLLAPHIRVFGRCTPHDKVAVVRNMVESGKITLMCGDGGNDTGALKAAHVGVALSDAEASMVAPFASLDKDIRSVLDVIKEGRCALASALATYKYMIMYGQVETIIREYGYEMCLKTLACRFLTVQSTLKEIINAYFQITFSEWCWVFMDGIWTITMAFTLPMAKPHDRLADTLPTSSILCLHTLSSALGVLLLNFFFTGKSTATRSVKLMLHLSIPNCVFTVLAITLLSDQDWYSCRKWTDTDVSNVSRKSHDPARFVTGLTFFS